MELHIGSLGVGSRFLSELSSLPPLLYFTSCVGFFLNIWFHSQGCDVCRVESMAERYYGCLTCECELHIRMFSLHPCLFIYIVQFDICASCYSNKDPSALEIEDHKMDPQLAEWTTPVDGI